MSHIVCVLTHYAAKLSDIFDADSLFNHKRSQDITVIHPNRKIKIKHTAFSMHDNRCLCSLCIMTTDGCAL